MKPVLIFPGGMPRSLEYLQSCLRDGVPVIGASSLDYDVSRDDYPEWLFLPFITDSEFDTALRQALLTRGIGGIYTPNLVVWEYLSRRLGEIAPGVTLVNPSPVNSEVAPYHKALQFGASVLAEPLTLAASGTPKPFLPMLEIAALFRHAESIPGMCDHEKIRALCELFRHAPSGDVVEIGSWWGKSAFVLNWLADCYGVGKLLCVDPWSNEHLIQKDEKGLVDCVPVNADEALTVFQLNLLPYAHGAVNYLRLPSVEAAKQYRCSRGVTTPAFGAIIYTGRIAVLHIDGNHSYENVRADVDAWAELVVPGGWIVIDTAMAHSASVTNFSLPTSTASN